MPDRGESTPLLTTPEIRLILASGSPRRRELLGLLGLPFDVAPAHISEIPADGESPVETASRLALAKAEAASASGSVTIGADTIVVFERRLIGKPRDPQDARAILKLLRGQTHQVVTALALVDARTGRAIRGAESTDVTLRSVSDAEIRGYVATGDPIDKAGAYAIQNEAYGIVAAIRGCYSGVLGLPLCLLAAMGRELGIAFADGWVKAGETCDCTARLLGHDRTFASRARRPSE